MARWIAGVDDFGNWQGAIGNLQLAGRCDGSDGNSIDQNALIFGGAARCGWVEYVHMLNQDRPYTR